jgi:hypothetical protein
MSERFEIDKIRRYQAGLEAIQLLDEAGFGIQDFELSAEGIRDVPISLDLELTIKENERPLQVLENDD